MSDHEGKDAPALPLTVRPPFDPEEFARETDSKIRLESVPPSSRPTAPPPGSAPSIARVSDVPVLAVSRDDLDWFELTSRAREVLRQLNGRDDVEALAQRLRTPPDDLLVEIEGLAREGLVTWR